MDLELLYSSLPWPVQNVAVSVEGWRIKRSRFAGSFSSLLQEAEERSSWPLDQLREYRDRRLRAFVAYCAKNVPYYQTLFNQIDFHHEDFRCIEDLRGLPFLDKKSAQEHYAAMNPVDQPSASWLQTHTSGTTGSGLRFAITRMALQEQWAIWWRFRRWHGLQPGTWCAYFGGRSIVPLSQTDPPFWRYNFPGKQILFSIYHMTSRNLDHYVSVLRRQRPPWLHGYPSALSLLAAYIVDRKIDLGYDLRWLTTGAETLFGHQSYLLKQAFGIHPRQHYGLAEAVANASECECGKMHIDEDFAAVELLENPSGYGLRVVGTNFTNIATPLLRYDPHDIATISAEPCSCGKAGRVLQSIDGRAEDYIMLANGALVGRLDHIFKDLVNVREAQVFQKERGSIIIRLVRGLRYTAEDEQQLVREARKRLGETTDIIIDHVERIERSSTGKLRFVVSEIPECQLGQLSK